MTAVVESLVITNAQIVTGDELVKGSFSCAGEVFDGVDVGNMTHCANVDFDGDIVIPGLIELHTDNLEKHLAPRPNVHWPAFAALQAHDAQVASAGITTVYDAVYLGDRDGREERHRNLSEAVDAIREGSASGLLRAEHFLHLRCEVPKPHVLELFHRYVDDPITRFVSLMDHTPGDRQFLDMDRYKDSCLKLFGEDEETYTRRVARDRENHALYAKPHREAIAKEARARGYVIASHDDATQAHIDDAKELGIGVSEFPTTLEAAKAARVAGLRTVMGAPNVIRGGSHSGNIAATDLAQVDCLDALSSDYMPVSLVTAPFLIRDELGWSLPRAVALVTKNPAKMAGMDDRGEIAPGKRADFVRIRETAHGPFVREVWRAGRRIA
jgi:alpha-D-ribose 1-methylphosphonate 5-triphosphate diphosphatase